MALAGEGRKRVVAIIEGILVARHIILEDLRESD